MSTMKESHWLLEDTGRLEHYLAFCEHGLRTARKAALPLAVLDRYRRKTSVLEHECRTLDRPGVVLEFGVYKGRSLRKAAGLVPQRRLVGFDSFAGLPADGRTDWKKDFAVDALPEVPRNVELIVGWFDDTLPPFLHALQQPIALVHIDCDIHSSTSFVLQELRRQGYFVPGLRMVFDELFNHPFHLWNELLAFYEILASTGLGFRWRRIHRRARSVEETIDLLEQQRFPTRKARKQTRREGYWFQAGAVELIEHPQPVDPDARAVARRLAPRFADLTRKHFGKGLRPSRRL